jgi:uncharacterized protein
LSRLGRLLMEDRFTQEAEKTLRTFSRSMIESPTGLTAMLIALADRLGPAQEVVITGPMSQAQPLIQEYRRHFLPNATLLFRGSDAEAESLAGIVPFVRDLTPFDGHATACVCENYACHRPVTTPQELRDLLGRNQ